MISRALSIIPGLILGAFPAGPSAASDRPSGPDSSVVALINGEPITTADLDALVIESHTKLKDIGKAGFDSRKFLDRLINDRLLVQQAVALGLDEEEAIYLPLEERRTASALRHYVNTHFTAPKSVAEQKTRSHFRDYYWKIRLRQISVPAREFAEELVQRIRSGASMDSLAREVSVDPLRYQGGRHNLKVWADVPIELREHSEDLEVGEICEPFPYREVHSFLRVEERVPADDGEFEKHEPAITAYLLAKERETALENFVQEHRKRFPLEVDSLALAEIAADSSRLFTADFLLTSERRLMSVDDERFVTETEFRRSLSHAAMNAAQVPFRSLFQQTFDKMSAELVLLEAAEASGAFEAEEVVRDYDRRVDAALIEAYLSETIAPRIKFRRSEFQEYYDENVNDFREPTQVRVRSIVVPEEETAREVTTRLSEGANFEFLKALYADSSVESFENPSWVSISIFSIPIREELLRVEIGRSSEAIQVPTGWIVFKLVDRKPGRLRSLEEVDPQIREVMFQRKFNELLDEHLGLLKERSDMQLFETRIEEYFGPQS